MKYPRTYHLPSSPGTGHNDRKLESDKHFHNKSVVITEKLDGENTSLLRTAIHARSVNSLHHPSQSAVKALYNGISWMIPDYLQVVGENVYAKHSIFYDHLSSYFYGFAVIDLNQKIFLSFSDTINILKKLSIEPVPLLYRGIYNPKWTMPNQSSFGEEIEGYVIRLEEAFKIEDMNKSMAKWVRSGHVQTTEHWKRNWTPNKIRST